MVCLDREPAGVTRSAEWLPARARGRGPWPDCGTGPWAWHGDEGAGARRGTRTGEWEGNSAHTVRAVYYSLAGAQPRASCPRLLAVGARLTHKGRAVAAGERLSPVRVRPVTDSAKADSA